MGKVSHPKIVLNLHVLWLWFICVALN
jgi:hypothetical protein